MDNEENKQSAEKPGEPPGHSEEEIRALYREVKKETDNLRQMLLQHLAHLKQNGRRHWLTSNEVQKYLRVSKLTLKRYRDNHNIRFTVMWGRFRYDPDDVVKLVKK